MSFIEVEVVGNTDIKLAKLFSLLDPASIGAWLGTTVREALQQRAQARFKNEGDDAVGKWAELSPATQDIRSSMQYGAAHPINVRTGELQDFIENNNGRIMVEPDAATLSMPGDSPTGELSKKFLGAQQGEGSAPPRPVLGISMTDVAATMTALELYITTGMDT